MYVYVFFKTCLGRFIFSRYIYALISQMWLYHNGPDDLKT